MCENVVIMSVYLFLTGFYTQVQNIAIVGSWTKPSPIVP